MQQFINFQTKICLFCLSFILLGTLSSCDSLSSLTDAEHVERAKDARDQGDLKASVIELKNALQKNPDNAEARRLLGVNYVHLGNGAAAEKELRRALNLGVAKEAIIFHLAEALQTQGKHNAILDTVDISSSLPKSNQAELHAYRGDAWLALKQIGKARTEYEQALAVDNKSPYGKLGVAMLAAIDNEIEEALLLITEALNSAPDEGKLWSFRAALYNRKGMKQEAEESYSKAINLRSINQMDRVERAIIRIELSNLDGADKDIQIVLTQAPQYFKAHFANGLLAAQKKDFHGAQTAFEQSIKLNNQFMPVYYHLGVANFYQKELNQAEQNLTRFKTANPRSANVHRMLALTYYGLREYEKSKMILRPLIENNPDELFANNLLANIEMALRNTKSALKHLETVTQKEPNPETIMRYGVAMLLNGQTKAGTLELEKAIALNPGFKQANVKLVLALIKEGDYDKALEVARQYRAEEPRNPLPLTLIGAVYLFKNQTSKAKATFQEALKLAPNNTLALSGLSILALQEGDIEAATTNYYTIFQHNPEHLITLLKLAAVERTRGHSDNEKMFLERAVRSHPNALQPTILLARYFIRFGQPRKALETAIALLEQNPNNAELLSLVGNAELTLMQNRNALTRFKRISEHHPKSANVHYLLAKAYAANANAEDAKKELDKALTLNPQHFESKFALARIYLMANKLEESESLIGDLAENNSNHPEVLSLTGELALAKGQPEEALNMYLKAAAIAPSSALTGRISAAQLQKGDTKAAFETMNSWLASHPDDTEIRNQLASAYSIVKNPDRAIEEFKFIIKKNPNHVMALNNLAWLLRRKDQSQAMQYAEKAIDLAPKFPPVIDTFALILMDQGEQKKAIRLLENLLKQAPAFTIAQYHLAEALVNIKDYERAKTILENLLSKHPDSLEFSQAQALLENIENQFY